MQPPPHVPRKPHRTPHVEPRVTQRGQIRFAFHDGSSPTIERAEGRSEKKLDTRGGTVGGFPKKSPPPPPLAVRLRSRPVAAAAASLLLSLDQGTTPSIR
uniref:Uncharacterized protein n=1 Tax=Oryza meridionalis TaxID=40149 RepID=A0A0E0C6S7_9ORYZ